ncbi:MAG: hypothetical protein ACKPKO_16390, partial [Candidatus Fonsibacter sp.]
RKLLTTDTQVLQTLGYDITDEQEMDDIKDDLIRMKDIMGTNEDSQDMYDNHGDNYISGFYFKMI